MSYRIYKIINDFDENVYIGSTSKSLDERMLGHKCKYKTSTSSIHMHMLNIGFEHFKIELIRELGDVSQLYARKQEEIERQIYDDVCLNDHKCYTSKEERRKKDTERQNAFRHTELGQIKEKERSKLWYAKIKSDPEKYALKKEQDHIRKVDPNIKEARNESDKLKRSIETDDERKIRLEKASALVKKWKSDPIKVVEMNRRRKEAYDKRMADPEYRELKNKQMREYRQRKKLNKE